MEVYTFNLFDQNISVGQIKKDSYIICWAGQFLGEDKIISDCVTQEEALVGNDYRIVKRLWDILNSANVLIGHNIRGYDNPKINARFIKYGLPPINKTQTIDTLAIARQHLGLPSKSLKYLNKFFGIKQKQENDGMPLWIACGNGDKVALANMLDYCEGDIRATLELLKTLRPFITGINLAVYFDDDQKRCTNCTGTKLSHEGYVWSNSAKYETFRCDDCGAVMRGKENLLSKDKRKSLLVN